MANQEYNSHINRVLKSYQNSAVKSLHGPSSYMNSDDERSKKTDLIQSSTNSTQIHGYKKILRHQALRSENQQLRVSSDKHSKQNQSNQNDDVSQKSCVTQNSNRSSYCSSLKTDVGDDVDLKYQQRLKSCQNLVGDGPRECHVFDLDSSTAASDGGCKVCCYDDGSDLEKCPVIVTDSKSSSYSCAYRNEEEKWLDKRAIATAALLQIHEQKESQGPQTYHDVATTQASRSTPNSYGGWAEVGTFTPPSPHSPTAYSSSPPHATFPFVMGHADVCGGKGEALLEGHKVPCFIIGGERRLCFPRVLCTSLENFSMAQINAEIESLYIYLSLCSSRQLQVLKDADALPSDAKSCGLITYSDAHRLTHALVHANAPQADPPKTVTLPYNSSTHQFISNTKTSQLTSVNSHSTNQFIPNIIVSHRCFGKCRGWVYLSLYDHPDAKCIQCCECRSFYSPEQFVCHAHRSLETRTCHWGFDPANWRTYLQLASDQPRQPTSPGNNVVVLPETFLEQFKTKFSSTGINATRPRQGRETDTQHGHDIQAGNASTYHAHQPQALDGRNRNDLHSMGGNFDDSRECVTIIDERQALTQSSGADGDDACEIESSGRLATLSVPSKSGKSLAPPPAALVRESLPAPLPPNLRSKGPPMLADPAQVVPLSQYDKFPHYQPNITLAPPRRRGSDTQRELYLSETSLDEISRKGQNAIDVLDGKEMVVKGRCRDRHLAEQEQEVSAKAPCDFSEKQNSRVMHPRSDGKSYSISMCPSYRSVEERNLKTLSHLSKEYASNGTPVIVTNERDANDRKQYFTHQDLGLLPMGGASVPKDLQIIKLDANFVSDGRCNRDLRGASESTPTDLKIFKLVPPTDGSAEPPEEKYSQSQEFTERRNLQRVAPITEHRVIIKEEVASDHESGSTCTYWRKNIPQPVTVREIQQFNAPTSVRAEDYDSRSPEPRRCAGISDVCAKSRDRSCSTSGTCRHRSRSFSPRLIKVETAPRRVPVDAIRIVGEIASILERWSDKTSATRVLDLVQCLTAGLGVLNDNSGTDRLCQTEPSGVRASSCYQFGCSHSVSSRKQFSGSTGDSVLCASTFYAKNDTDVNEKKKVTVPLNRNVNEHLNESGMKSGVMPRVIEKEVENNQCDRQFKNDPVRKNSEVQTSSPASATQSLSQDKKGNVESDDSGTMSVKSSGDRNASPQMKSDVVINVTVKSNDIGEDKPNPAGVAKSNEDTGQQEMDDIEVSKNVPFKRDGCKKNEGVVVNAACKRQLLEDRSQTPSPELKARICTLEEELSHLKSELQSCKKQKTEPVDSSTQSHSSKNHSCSYGSSRNERLSSKQDGKASCDVGSSCELTEEKYNCPTVPARSLTRDRSKSRENKDRRTATPVTKLSRRNTLELDVKSISSVNDDQPVSEVTEGNESPKKMECRSPDDRIMLKGGELSRTEKKNFCTFSNNRQSDVVNVKHAGYSRDLTRARVCDDRGKKSKSRNEK